MRFYKLVRILLFLIPQVENKPYTNYNYNLKILSLKGNVMTLFFLFSCFFFSSKINHHINISFNEFLSPSSKISMQCFSGDINSRIFQLHMAALKKALLQWKKRNL